MTVPGKLNRRLVLEAPVDVADGGGGVTRHYQPVSPVWAQLVPLGALPDVAAGRLGVVLRWRIVIRARSDVTTHHRLRDGDRTYRVLGAQLSADRRFLAIEGEEQDV
ncbi:MAG TPA: phage head closure protein [Pseudolabrys sp.]|nr:phage head closure protein [Pseudolabrys sp.]